MGDKDITAKVPLNIAGQRTPVGTGERNSRARDSVDIVLRSPYHNDKINRDIAHSGENAQEIKEIVFENVQNALSSGTDKAFSKLNIDFKEFYNQYFYSRKQKKPLTKTERKVAEDVFNAIKKEANIVASSSKPILKLGVLTSRIPKLLLPISPIFAPISSVVNSILRSLSGKIMGDEDVNNKNIFEVAKKGEAVFSIPEKPVVEKPVVEKPVVEKPLEQNDFAADMAPVIVPTPAAPLVRTLSGHNLAASRKGKNLGKGCFGQVARIHVHDTRGKSIVRKAVAKSSKKREDHNHEKDAAHILHHAGLRDHRNIAYIYGELDQGPETAKEMIYSEYQNTGAKFSNNKWHLSSLRRKGGKPLAKAMIKGIASATDDMLQKQIRHNDLHIENVMYEKNFYGQINARIIDFGMLTQVSPEEDKVLGFMDYNETNEQILIMNRESAVKHGRKSDDAYMLYDQLNGALNTRYDSRNRDIRNNPISSISTLLHEFYPYNFGLKKQCSDIMHYEKRLMRIHAVLYHMKKTNSDHTNNNAFRGFEPLLAQHDLRGKSKEGLHKEAAELAQEIRRRGDILLKAVKRL